MSPPRVLLYHSVYEKVPFELGGLIHNVSPENLYRQLKWCRDNYEFVKADELFTKPCLDCMSVTFDDANESVFSEALPILASLGIPATIFVNGVSILGSPLWREKIRWLIKSDLIHDFLKQYPMHASHLPFESERFFKATKTSRVNSVVLDRDLDAYLSSKEITGFDLFNPVQSIHTLPIADGISYGNHGFNHYLLSSLTPMEQEREIVVNQSLINSKCANQSRVFAVPFGGASDHNDVTWKILRQQNYLGMFADIPPSFNPYTGIPWSKNESFPCITRLKAPEQLEDFRNLLETVPAQESRSVAGIGRPYSVKLKPAPSEAFHRVK